MERWCKRFCESQDDLEDGPRPGKSVAETTSEKIVHSRLIIDDDYRASIEDIQEQSGFSDCNTQRMITEHLLLANGATRYLPKQLTDL